jgi:coenzyme F420 hydrogenase subunit beta
LRPPRRAISAPIAVFPEASDIRTPAGYFSMTCRTCVDYTNVLADITVGYMGGQGEQWLLVRNPRGEESEVRLSEPRSPGKCAGPVRGFLKNVELAAGGLPVRSMPNWIRPIMG